MGQRLTKWFYLVPMALLLGLAACATQRGENDLNEAEFKVSLNNVLFAKDGGSESVTVTGVKDWSYLSNVGENSWLTPSKSGNNLTLTATQNPSGRDRKAEILISSKLGVQKIYVTQSASDLVLNFSEQALTFSHKAGEKIVQVTTNSDTWSFEPLSDDAKEWLSIVGATSGAKIIVLKVTDNKSYDDRSTTLIATAQNGEKVGLKVTQKGIAKYLLPYEPTAEHYNDVDLITFEQNRGSILQGYRPAAFDNFEKKEIFGVAIFLTTSDYMPQMIYKRDLGEVKYTMAQSLLKFSDEEQTELKEYHDFLEANGYKKIKEYSKDLEWYYFNQDRAMAALINIQQGMAVVTYEPIYFQTKPYPTFPAVPTGRAGWLDQLANPKIKAEAVLKAEQEAGSTQTFLHKDADTGYIKNAGFGFVPSANQYDPIAGTYWFYMKAPKNATDEYIQSVQEQCLYFSNPSWGIRTVGRRHFVTLEFEKLLTAAGYKYDSVDENKTFYYYKPISETQVQILYVKIVHFSDLNNDHPALQIGYFTSFSKKKAPTMTLQQAESAIQSAINGNFDALNLLRSDNASRWAHERVSADERTQR